MKTVTMLTILAIALFQVLGCAQPSYRSSDPAPTQTFAPIEKEASEMEIEESESISEQVVEEYETVSTPVNQNNWQAEEIDEANRYWNDEGIFVENKRVQTGIKTYRDK